MEEIRSLQREDQGDCGMHAGDMMMQGVWWHASVLPCLWLTRVINLGRRLAAIAKDGSGPSSRLKF